MPIPIRASLMALAVFCGLSVSPVTAGLILPGGLSPGDPYHFAFVTEGKHNALSSDISVYNDFVQAEAERIGAVTAGSGYTWKAIASTPTTDARDNVDIQGKVFLLDGTMIASDASDLWDGALASPLKTDQFLDTTDALLVWTGSFPNGTKTPLFELGGVLPISTTGTPHLPVFWSTTVFPFFKHFEKPLYGVSQAMWVEEELPHEECGPATVPEPASFAAWLGIAGFGVLSVRGRRKHNRGKSPAASA